MSGDLEPSGSFTLSPDELRAQGDVPTAIQARHVDPGRTTRRFLPDGSVEVTVWPPFPTPSPDERAAAALALAEAGAPVVRATTLLALPALVAGGALGGAVLPGHRLLGVALGGSFAAFMVAALAWKHWPRESPDEALGEVYLDDQGDAHRRVNTPALQGARAVLAWAPARWAMDAWRTPALCAAAGAIVGLSLLPTRRWGAPLFASLAVGAVGAVESVAGPGAENLLAL